MSLKKYLYAVAESHFLKPISEDVYFNPGVEFYFHPFNYCFVRFNLSSCLSGAFWVQHKYHSFPLSVT